MALIILNTPFPQNVDTLESLWDKGGYSVPGGSVTYTDWLSDCPDFLRSDQCNHHHTNRATLPLVMKKKKKKYVYLT